MKTIALITFIAIVCVFIYLLWQLIKEFNEPYPGELDDHDSIATKTRKGEK